MGKGAVKDGATGKADEGAGLDVLPTEDNAARGAGCQKRVHGFRCDRLLGVGEEGSFDFGGDEGAVSAALGADIDGFDDEAHVFAGGAFDSG